MYRGFILNLDRSQDRLNTIARNIQEAGLSAIYQRFPAVDGRALDPQYKTKLDPGALGLWLTHEKLLNQNLTADAHLHFLEDDAFLPKDASACLPALLGAAANVPWDLLFTDALLLPKELALFQYLCDARGKYLRGNSSLLPLKGIPFAGTTSMFINKASIGKYLKTISGQWTQGDALDLFLRKAIWAGNLQAFVVVPFLTTISRHSDVSSIQARSRSSIVMDIYRRALYKDADLAALNQDMRRQLAEVKNNPLIEIFAQTLSFMLSDEFANF